MGAGALCGLDYIDIIYLYWLLLLTLGLLPCGIGFFGHAIEQRLQHGQQAGRERLSQPVTYVGRDDFGQSGVDGGFCCHGVRLLSRLGISLFGSFCLGRRIPADSSDGLQILRRVNLLAQGAAVLVDGIHVSQ